MKKSVQWMRAIQNGDQSLVPRTRKFAHWLALMLDWHPSPRIRYIAAHWASWRDGRCLCHALLRRAADLTEHPLVRGQALEGLTNHASWHPAKTARDRIAHHLAMSCLRSRDANVRFWACFAVADFRLRCAAPLLRKMLDDHRVGEMGWTVAYEAEEALKSLRGEPAWQQYPEKLPSAYERLW